MKPQNIFSVPLFLLFSGGSYCDADEAEFNAVVRKMESDLLDFVRRIESYHPKRCDYETLALCRRSNHHETFSSLWGQQCFTTGDLHIDVCGDSCGALWDDTTSTVRIADHIAEDTVDYYPKDRLAVEVVCYSALMDDYVRVKKIEDQSFWDSYGVRSPQVYFGSATGAFRIFPGRTSETAGEYDPRERPWYIAASSGPKNVILILDTSETMEGRLKELKAAAKQVVSSLSINDRVAIVEYAAEARKIGRDSGRYVYQATQDKIDTLLAEIDSLEAHGSKNTYDAFVKAFEILDDSLTYGLAVGCNTAILFLTDGILSKDPKSTQEASEQRVTNFVTSELDRFRESAGHDVLLFTFTVDASEDVELFPKSLACATGGVWSRIVSDQDIMDALTSYYRLFAFGLGTGPNENFTTWVEPYSFATGGIIGTTVSAPVYDRSGDHPLFLGVAGIDVSLEFADRVLNLDAKTSFAFENLVEASTATCPVLNLTLCELESYRRSGAAGDQALCSDQCNTSEFVAVEEEPCDASIVLPKDLWINRQLEGLPYERRVCCQPGNDVSSEECVAVKEGLSVPGIVGIAIAGITLMLMGAFGLGWWVARRRRRTAASEPPYGGVIIMPPPSEDSPEIAERSPRG